MMDDHLEGIYIFQQKSATLVEIEDAVSTFSSGSRLHCTVVAYTVATLVGC